MRLSGCTGKTLGRPAAVRGRTSGLCAASNCRLVIAGAMVDSPGRTLGSAGMMIVLIGLALYAAAGVAIAAAFVVFGVTRVLPEPLPVTVGARILLFPGAALLWPYVLARWLKSLR